MFKKILVPIDLQHESSWRKALPVAASQARQSGAKLVLLNVIPDVRPVDPNRHEEEDRQKQLRELAKQQGSDDLDVDIEVEHYDSVHRCIRRKVSDEGVDLVVMNSHHPELKDYVLGSNAAQVVHHADCSVFVIR